MKTLIKIAARPHVMHVDDERSCGNAIIIMLKDGWDYSDDPGCGTKGFDTVSEAEQGTRANAVQCRVTA